MVVYVFSLLSIGYAYNVTFNQSDLTTPLTDIYDFSDVNTPLFFESHDFSNFTVSSSGDYYLYNVLEIGDITGYNSNPTLANIYGWVHSFYIDFDYFLTNVGFKLSSINKPVNITLMDDNNELFNYTLTDSSYIGFLTEDISESFNRVKFQVGYWNTPIGKIYDQIIVDDITSTPAPVPEPSTILLLLTGLCSYIPIQYRLLKS